MLIINHCVISVPVARYIKSNLFILEFKSSLLEDTYSSIENPTPESFFKEKGSKFFGYGFPVENEVHVKEAIEKLKRQHPTAGHFCYAWQLGVKDPIFKVNDDGEPNNSAGPSIHGQIRSFNLTNILVVSVRYFGGTKLGVGGLKQAYKHSAHITLAAATIVEKTIDVYYQLNFDHALMNQVMRIIKEKKIKILSQDLALACVLKIAIRKRDVQEVMNRFDRLYKVNTKKII